jgi:hypothetical protein
LVRRVAGVFLDDAADRMAGTVSELRDTLCVYVGETVQRRPGPIHAPQHRPKPAPARRAREPEVAACVEDYLRWVLDLGT